MKKMLAILRGFNAGDWIAGAAVAVGLGFVVWFSVGSTWNTLTYSLQPEVPIVGERSYDLVAQRSMAAAAWWMVGLTGLSIIVGSLSLYLIFRTLQEAKRSADAAHDAVAASNDALQSAREMGQAQVRA